MKIKRSMVVLFAVAVSIFAVPSMAFAATSLPETVDATESLSFDPLLYATGLLALITVCSVVVSIVYHQKYLAQKELICHNYSCHNNRVSKQDHDDGFDYSSFETPKELSDGYTAQSTLAREEAQQRKALLNASLLAPQVQFAEPTESQAPQQVVPAVQMVPEAPSFAETHAVPVVQPLPAVQTYPETYAVPAMQKVPEAQAFSRAQAAPVAQPLPARQAYPETHAVPVVQAPQPLPVRQAYTEAPAVPAVQAPQSVQPTPTSSYTQYEQLPVETDPFEIVGLIPSGMSLQAAQDRSAAKAAPQTQLTPATSVLTQPVQAAAAVVKPAHIPRHSRQSRERSALQPVSPTVLQSQAQPVTHLAGNVTNQTFVTKITLEHTLPLSSLEQSVDQQQVVTTTQRRQPVLQPTDKPQIALVPETRPAAQEAQQKPALEVPEELEFFMRKIS